MVISEALWFPGEVFLRLHDKALGLPAKALQFPGEDVQLPATALRFFGEALHGSLVKL